MADFIALVVIVALVALDSIYIYKEKKKGTKCIGCPYSCSCSKQSACSHK